MSFWCPFITINQHHSNIVVWLKRMTKHKVHMPYIRHWRWQIILKLKKVKKRKELMVFMHQCEMWACLPYVDHDYSWCSVWLNAFFLGSGLHSLMCNLAKYPGIMVGVSWLIMAGVSCHSLFNITNMRYLMVFWCIDFMRF